MGRAIMFRVDGGNIYSVAMGHVYRCMRLARLLQKRGIDCIFLMKNYPEGVGVVNAAGFTADVMDEAISSQAEADKALALAASRNAVLHVDLRMSKKELVDRAMEQGVPTAVYEDVSSEDIAPDLLINPALMACNEVNYSSLKKTRHLFGLAYLVLDPALHRFRRPGFSPTIDRMFLCFGGADPCNITSRVIEILLSRSESFAMDLVLGPAFGHCEDVQKVLSARDPKSRAHVIRNCKELLPIHAHADAAITAGGTLVYESLALGVPTMVLPSIDTEAGNVAPLIDKGLLSGFARDVAEVGDAVLASAIDRFITDTSKRERLFHAQVRTDLGGGAERVVEHLIGLL